MSYNDEYSTCNRFLLEQHAEWLDTVFPWSAICVFTYHGILTRKTAREKMEHMTYDLIDQYGEGTHVFWVTEPFRDSKSYHVHALIKIDVPPEKMEEHILYAWHKVARPAGYKKHSLTSIKPYIKGKGGHYYVAKYLQWERADWGIY
jgi:hypothetical protein